MSDGLDGDTFVALLELVKEGRFKSELAQERQRRLAGAIAHCSDDQLRALIKASK